MASSYPSGLDAFATNRTDGTAMATTHAADHNNENDAINKIEAELGTLPKSSYASVNARLNAIEAAIAGLSAGGGLQDASIQYVLATGSDGNNGQSWTTAKRTIQSAYSALPAAGAGTDIGGGFIFIGPGNYDVGTGVILADNKPARFAAAVGGRHHRHEAPSVQSDRNVRVYSSGTPTALFSYTTSGTLMSGCEWQGLNFDISSSTTTASAIYAEGMNHGLVRDCNVEGVSPNSTPQYLLRAKDGSAGDCSWWRFEANNTRNAGLAYMGTSTDTNVNQNVFIANDIQLNNGIGIRLQSSSSAGHRNVTLGNNFESSGGSGIGLQLDGTCGGVHVGDGGEGCPTFIKTAAGGGNLFLPIGVPAGNPAAAVLIDDQANNGDVIVTAAMQGNGYGTGTTNLDHAIAFSGNGSGNTFTPTYDALWPKPTRPVTLADVISLIAAYRLSA